MRARRRALKPLRPCGKDEKQTSEQASRILSMQMANDNAIKLLKGLQLEYNKLRQQNITAELMDIAGGSVE